MGVTTSIFLDPASDNAAVLRAVSGPTTGEIPVDACVQVANDPSCRPFHRAVAVRELFRRYMPKPVTLRTAALLLKGARWLGETTIDTIDVMAGELQVQVPMGGTAFVIRFSNEGAAADSDIGIYLAVDGALDADGLRDALTSNGTDSVMATRIVDFATFPDTLRLPHSR